MTVLCALITSKNQAAQGRSRSFIGTKEQPANTLTSWHCKDLLFAREDIEEYKIKIPTPMTILQNASSDTASTCVNSSPRCPSKGV